MEWYQALKESHQAWVMVIGTSLGTTIPLALMLHIFRKQSRKQWKEFHAEMRKLDEKYQNKEVE